MIEVRRIKDLNQWWHPSGIILPTVNLTPSEIKKLAQREAQLDKLASLTPGSQVWIRLNTGIFRGSTFPAELAHDYGKIRHQLTVMAWVDPKADRDRAGTSIHNYTRNLDTTKKWDWAKRSLTLHFISGDNAINFTEGSIFPHLISSTVFNDASLLLDYAGDRVFCLNEAKRSMVFKDRLDQDVTLGDLVVVALNYGAGLDICVVKGFADEKRIVIESVISGDQDRITLEDDKTVKVMRMPNTLKDTALMLKLAR
jgi:hypothetical protein